VRLGFTSRINILTLQVHGEGILAICNKGSEPHGSDSDIGIIWITVLVVIVVVVIVKISSHQPSIIRLHLADWQGSTLLMPDTGGKQCLDPASGFVLFRGAMRDLRS